MSRRRREEEGEELPGLTINHRGGGWSALARVHECATTLVHQVAGACGRRVWA